MNESRPDSQNLPPQEKIALVTGGSRGIGRAICLELARTVDKIAFIYASSAKAAKETQDALEKAGCTPFAVEADVANMASVQEAFRQVQEFLGHPTIIVNNAGRTNDKLLLQMDESDWQGILDTNLTGAFNVTKTALRPMLKARWGRIINISSVSGYMGAPGQANYAASKAGLIGFSRSLARELGSRNITCNVVAPGPIETDLIANLEQSWVEATTSSIPLGRFGRPDEVASAVAYLASEKASYISGAVLPVDGGMGMGA